jgi:radical SAM superfamily enzyme YgiQ (UPF0313 family)
MAVVARAVREAGHDVVQVDYMASGQSLEALVGKARGENPEVVGISLRNIDNVNLAHEQRYVNVVRDIVQALKEALEVTVVLGGSGYSFFPREILALSGADYGIVGEGEASFPALLRDLAAGHPPEERILGPMTAPVQGADIGPALYDGGIMDFYLRHGNVAALQTKRGCDHRCVYCTYPFLEGRSIRRRPPEEVVDDLEALVGEHSAEMVFFTDSLFNDDSGTYLDVLHAMRRRGVKVPWTAFFKPADIAAGELELLKETGLKAVELGSDAATDATLRGLGKSFRFAEVRACNDIFVENGIAVAHYFMFGGPGETEETVREGIGNILSLEGSVSFVFMGIRILPNTPLHRTAVADGVVSADDDLLESKYYLAPGLDREWLERTLTDAFARVRKVVFPPDALERSVQFLHKLGHTGLLWDMLIQ